MIVDQAKEILIKSAGSAAGTVVDPKRGFEQMKKTAKSPLVAGVALGLAAGYLYGRRAAKH